MCYFPSLYITHRPLDSPNTGVDEKHLSIRVYCVSVVHTAMAQQLPDTLLVPWYPVGTLIPCRCPDILSVP